MLVTRSYALCKKLQSFIDLKVIGGENHGERFCVVDEQLLSPEEVDNENVFGPNVQLDTGVFQLVPFKTPTNPKIKRRNTYYITGPNGIGKTVFASKLAAEYMAVNPYNNLIWMTPIPDCPELHALNPIIINISSPEMVQLNIYDENERLRIVDNPDDDIFNQTSQLQNSMIIFDDIEGCENPKLINKIYTELVNPSFTVGRHFNISVILIKHHAAEYSKTRTFLLEAEYLTVFPRDTPRNAIRHLLSYYVGLRPDQINDIINCGQRHVTIHNRYPIASITNDTFEVLTV